jgi:hypothetical protein
MQNGNSPLAKKNSLVFAGQVGRGMVKKAEILWFMRHRPSAVTRVIESATNLITVEKWKRRVSRKNGI